MEKFSFTADELLKLDNWLSEQDREYLARAAEQRNLQSDEPLRPTYHFSAPIGALNDPNGLCYWQGMWHMFYQNDHGKGCMWGHAVSADLIHWKDLPLAIEAELEKACWSGMVMIEEDRAVAAYYGLDTGIMIATCSDPMLLHWEKLNQGNPVIPSASPDGKQKYIAFDPCIWKNGDKYCLISGKFTINEPSGRRERCGYLFESDDLISWKLKGNLIENDIFSNPDDDLACPYFVPCKDRYILFHFSHHSGPKVMVGDYDTERNKFIVTNAYSLTSSASFFGGLLAPSAYALPDGTVRAIFNVTHIAEPPTNYQVMSLPRKVTLSGKNNNDINIDAADEVEILRKKESHIEVNDIKLEANKPYEPQEFFGDTVEILAEFEAKKVPMLEIKVMMSEDREEYTALRIFRQRGNTYLPAFAKGFTYRMAHDTVVQLDTSFSTKVGSVRIPDEQAVWIAPDEKLNVRIFLDRTVVEVFVNGKVALTAKINPSSGDNRRIAITSRGDDLLLYKLEKYELIF